MCNKPLHPDKSECNIQNVWAYWQDDEILLDKERLVFLARDNLIRHGAVPLSSIKRHVLAPQYTLLCLSILPIWLLHLWIWTRSDIRAEIFIAGLGNLVFASPDNLLF